MREPTAALQLGARHYQVFCGLALGAMFFVQLQLNHRLEFNVLMLVVGAVSILYRIRLSALLVLIALAAAHLYEQHQLNRGFGAERFRMLDMNDVLLCGATLAFLASHYRLQGLRFGVLPAAKGPQGALLKAAPRGEETLSPVELAGLLFSIPAAVLASQFVGLLLQQHFELVGLPPRPKQVLTLIWTVLLVVFLTAHALRHWRRLQMDRSLALLLLHDILWNATRGEQRRIGRWVAWRRLRAWLGK